MLQLAVLLLGQPLLTHTAACAEPPGPANINLRIKNAGLKAWYGGAVGTARLAAGSRARPLGSSLLVAQCCVALLSICCDAQQCCAVMKFCSVSVQRGFCVHVSSELSCSVQQLCASSSPSLRAPLGHAAFLPTFLSLSFLPFLINLALRDGIFLF